MVMRQDLEDLRTWLEVRWGPSKAWLHAEQLYDDFRGLTKGAVMEAAHQLFRSGTPRCPTPAEVLARALDVQRQRIESGVDAAEFTPSCAQRHVWGRPWPSDADRRLVCVVCGVEGGVDRCRHVRDDQGRCFYCPDGWLTEEAVNDELAG